MLSSSLEADLAENKSIKELIKLTERLKVQDFISAHESAQECIKFVNEDIPISDSVNMDLLQLSTIVKKEKESNWATHERIAADVRQVINRSTNKSEDFKPILKGKALIWDETKKEVEMAYQLLPDNLRASSDDGVVTIFSVIKREHILQGHYSVSHEAGYKEKMTISVVYWPEKVSPGAVVIWGGDPAQLRVVSYSPEYGSSVNIRDWVKLLPQQK